MKKKAGPAKIRVMIVDDHKSMRKALRAIIELEPDLVLVAEAENGEVAIASLPFVKPDVVLMDKFDARTKRDGNNTASP